jgi:hypothetical protein
VSGRANSSATITGDGRFVSFNSTATNLVAATVNNLRDVFLRDRQNGTTERVNMQSGAESCQSINWSNVGNANCS